MASEYVLYQGRTIPKANFRAFIYSHDDVQKLVESWDDYENHISTSLWFSTKAEVPVEKYNGKGRK